jgi:hypothetical protein
VCRPSLRHCDIIWRLRVHLQRCARQHEDTDRDEQSKSRHRSPPSVESCRVQKKLSGESPQPTVSHGDRVLCVYALAAAFRRAAQYFFIRALTALRAAADIRRRRGAFLLARRARRAPVAKMNDTGNSSLSNESRRCGNSPIRFFASCTNSRSRTSAPRLASSRM